MKKYILLFIGLVFIVQTNLLAQKVTVNARLDSTVLRIGDQAHLIFEVSQQPNQKVVMPLFSDTIVRGLEMVEPVKTDTVKSEDGHILVNQSYLITSFDDSLLYIPPYPFIVDKDTIWSKSLSLKVVQPFQIDTASNTITDIKPVFNPKFDWMGLFKTVFLILVILAIILGLILLARKFLKKKRIAELQSKEPTLPAHIIALSELDRIKQEKLWQSGRSKEYHTQLTDVLRTYIERTFEINSLEMTSEEILEHLKTLKFEKKSAYAELKSILQLADLVKFAKWNPTPDEDESSLVNGFLFVNQTKIEEVIPLEELKNEEKKSTHEV